MDGRSGLQLRVERVSGSDLGHWPARHNHTTTHPVVDLDTRHRAGGHAPRWTTQRRLGLATQLTTERLAFAVRRSQFLYIQDTLLLSDQKFPLNRALVLLREQPSKSQTAHDLQVLVLHQFSQPNN